MDITLADLGRLQPQKSPQQALMHFTEGVRVALEALRANRLRTLLTLLANMVAVMSVMAVVSIINGLNSYIADAVAGQGSGVFYVQRANGLDLFRITAVS